MLRRQHLSLGCVDFQSTASEINFTRLVESRIKILDLEARLGATPSVLVAHHDATRTVYALERQRDGLYAMCRLGAWVDIELLAQDATAICHDRVFPVKPELSPPQQASLAGASPHLNSQQKKKRAAIEAIQSLVRKKPKAEPGPSGEAVAAGRPAVEQSIEEEPMPEIMIRHPKIPSDEEPMPDITIRHTKIPSDEESMPEIMIRHPKIPSDEEPMPEIMIRHPKLPSDEVPMPEMIPHVKSVGDETQGGSLAMGTISAPPSSQIHARAIDDGPQDMANNIFDNIRAHYFEALYKSMGSLAYFAKGPLSRARSAFHLDLEANLDMVDLIEFLKGLLLTTVQIDKKYRETAPEIISQLSAIIETSDEARSKKRKPKKMKIGKNGLYPTEDDRIRKWWNTNKPELDEEQANFSASQIRSHLSLLRTRETQLQMILILEIMALEPLKATEEAGDSSLPVLPGASASQAQRSPAAALTKKRNKHNLPVLIDVHADRLTIWQSTATDEQQLAEDSQVNRHSLNGKQVQKASSEPLKDFCTDVIVPLYVYINLNSSCIHS